MALTRVRTPGKRKAWIMAGASAAATVTGVVPVSYTHLRAHETVLDLVCRLLLEKKNKHHL